MNCPICRRPNRPNAHFCAHCRAPLLLQNKYRVTGLIKTNDAVSIWLAEQTNLWNSRCIIFRFINPLESQAHAAIGVRVHLTHRALPKAIDLFEEGGYTNLITELVEGEALDARLRRVHTPVPEADILLWMEELCDALLYLETQPTL